MAGTVVWVAMAHPAGLATSHRRVLQVGSVFLLPGVPAVSAVPEDKVAMLVPQVRASAEGFLSWEGP